MLTTLPRLLACRPHAELLHSSFPLCQVRDLLDFMRKSVWGTSACVHHKTLSSEEDHSLWISFSSESVETKTSLYNRELLSGQRFAVIVSKRVLSLFQLGALYVACHQANSWRYYPTGDLQFPTSPWGKPWPHLQRKFWHASCPSHQIAVETLWDSSLHTTKINSLSNRRVRTRTRMWLSSEYKKDRLSLSTSLLNPQ